MSAKAHPNNIFWNVTRFHPFYALLEVRRRWGWGGTARVWTPTGPRLMPALVQCTHVLAVRMSRQ